METKNKSGFTLVEILIVVVILGVLAAIVIPRFTNASEQSKNAALRSSLRVMRAQIELYRIRNQDLLPGQTVTGGNIVEADFFGNLSGMYIQRLPKNPYIDVDANKSTLACANGAGDSPAGDDSTAWWVNAANGDFRANTATHTGY